ncbi:MAG TPA: serine O-acetyltransferase EpsC [Candidatus Didemnitutus sp.]|nr:serine O-acetyltransferase EpsC [Candidatus Didemnitutus sp.]
MQSDALKKALLQSYASAGGINHLDGANLPSQDKINELARDCMHLLFPGFFEETSLTEKEAPAWLDALLAKIEKKLTAETEKCLRFTRDSNPKANAERVVEEWLGWLPEIRRVVQTDVAAAYTGDPAARSVEEIILAYPCVLAISLQRLAHVLYTLGVPLLPRMLTEFAHERTGIDIHPGAVIGPHFFIDHGTGVVIGETARIGAYVKIYQGVTLGAKSFETDAKGVPVKGVKRHPDIEDHVTIYAHATILGGTTRVGAHSIVGASVWLMDSIPPHSVAYYKDTDLVIRPRQAHESALEAKLPNGEHVDWAI